MLNEVAAMAATVGEAAPAAAAMVDEVVSVVVIGVEVVPWASIVDEAGPAPVSMVDGVLSVATTTIGSVELEDVW